MNELNTRTLPIITDEIRYLDAQATRLVIGHAMEIGRRLTEAKALVPYGEWGNYIRNELGYSQSTAENLMRVYERFGSAQMGLFGPEAKSEAIGNLTYTKAVKLLAVPEEALDDFLQAHPVEDMSTRELEKAIAEAKAAKKQAEKAEQDRAYAEGKLTELTQQFETSQDAIIQRDMKLQDKDSEIYDLRSKVKELENRPVEVAIEARRDEEAIRKAVQETEAKAKEELKRQEAVMEQLRAEWKKSLKELESSRKALEAAEEKLKTSTAGELDAAKEELQKLREAADKAERKAALGEVMALFKQWQNIRNQLLGAVNGLDWENKDKMTKAMRAQIKMWSEAE